MKYQIGKVEIYKYIGPTGNSEEFDTKGDLVKHIEYKIRQKQTRLDANLRLNKELNDAIGQLIQHLSVLKGSHYDTSK